jgi:addiction module RelE/StbE family toxin
MTVIVTLSKVSIKNLNKIPRNILILFELWVEILETDGVEEMQKMKGYRDHALKGKRNGQRSSSLNRSWRIIYTLNHTRMEVKVHILEVNHHDY